MSIFITGDIHGSIDIRKLKQLPKNLTAKDYVIILGDFGLIWDARESKEESYWLNWLSNRGFTTLFVDGNHENHDRLNSYPVQKWNGGNVHFIKSNIIHLMRGQVFTIDGLKFFTMGGAASHDIRDGILDPNAANFKEIKRKYIRENKLFRINKVSWWSAEMPSREEFYEGIKNLTLNNFKVDYILTHSPSTTEQILIAGSWYKSDNLTDYLDDVMSKIQFKAHFFGHMHIDKQITSNAICFYNSIKQIR